MSEISFLSKWSLRRSLAPFINDFFPLPTEFWEWHFSRKLFFFSSHDLFYDLLLKSDWWLITVQWNPMGSVDSVKSSLKCASSNCFWSVRLKTTAQLWQTLQVGPNHHPPQSFLLLEVVKWPAFSQWNRHLLRGECMGTLCSFGKMGHMTGTALNEDSVIGGSLPVTIKHEVKKHTQRMAEHKEWTWVLHAVIAELLNPHQQLSTPGLSVLQATQPLLREPLQPGSLLLPAEHIPYWWTSCCPFRLSFFFPSSPTPSISLNTAGIGIGWHFHIRCT